MKYRFMDEHRGRYSIKSMCRVLGAGRSGYYVWRSRQPSKRQRENKALTEQIREAYAKSRRLYGSPRITAELNGLGYRCGKNRVARLMREHCIRAEAKKRRFRRTTESKHDYALAANLLIDRNQTEGVWASDISVPQKAA